MERSDPVIGTREYGMYPTFIGGKLHILVDFPGFNSDNMSDFEVFQAMYDWFEFLNDARIKLKAVLFLYDVGHKRGTSGDKLCFDVLKAACGEAALANCALVMTNWDKQEKLGSVEHAKVLERDIAELYWGDALKYGRHGESFRFRGASETQGAKERDWKKARRSARNILREVGSNKKVRLLIQREIADGLRAKETTAWKELALGKGISIMPESVKLSGKSVPAQKPELPKNRMQLQLKDGEASASGSSSQPGVCGSSGSSENEREHRGPNYQRFFSYLLDALSRIFRFSWRR